MTQDKKWVNADEKTAPVDLFFRIISSPYPTCLYEPKLIVEHSLL